MPEYDSGNIAWILASAALVMVMTPGLAFFYAGMVRTKNVLSVIMQNWITMAIVSVMWTLIGFSLAFGPDAAAGLFGNLHHIGLGNLNAETYVFGSDLPPALFVVFQMMFAIITPALFTGSVAERMKFTPFVLLIILWTTLVYSPIAHWVWGPDGWLGGLGALDFAGGAVVHMNAGAAGLALAIVLGRRTGFPKGGPNHNVPFVVLGAALLWFGWFGFNAGSALGANELAASAFLATQVATAAAVLTWVLAERVRGSKPTVLGAASGAIAGLVAITPAAGFVNPIGALIIGLLAGFICNYASSLKYKLRIDDTLDVVGVHLVGGLVGALAIAFVATTSVNEAGADGIFYGGGWDLLGKQALAAAVTIAYSFVVTFILAKVLDLIFGLRATEVEEEAGLDLTEHGEIAYDVIGAADAAAIQANRSTGNERTGGAQ